MERGRGKEGEKQPRVEPRAGVSRGGGRGLESQVGAGFQRSKTLQCIS